MLYRALAHRVAGGASGSKVLTSSVAILLLRWPASASASQLIVYVVEGCRLPMARVQPSELHEALVLGALVVLEVTLPQQLGRRLRRDLLDVNKG